MHQLNVIWSPADQYMFLFYENSLKRSLVNLSEIISKASGVIDCDSDGKENQVGLTLICHFQFSICLIVTIHAAENRFSKHTLNIFHFSLH